MTQRVPYNSVIMIRAKRRLNEVAETVARIRRLEAPALLFFHAGAVEQLQDPASPWRELFDEPSIDVAYCSAAWQRRGFADPPAGVEASTLVRFWDALWRHWEAQSPSWDEGEPIRVTIDSPRDPQDWSDSLEVLLAAATLDLPLEVEFSASAWDALCRDVASRAAWQQLLDFEMARLCVRDAAPDPDQIAAGVEFPGGSPRNPSDRSRVFEL